MNINVILKKTITIAIILFFIVMAILPSMAQASNETLKAKKMTIPPGALTVDKLFSTTNSSHEPKQEGVVPFVDEGDAFEIRPEVLAKMSRDEIYRLKGLPGFFTPEQTSLQEESGQYSVLYNEFPQPIKAVIIIDSECYQEYACYEPWWGTWAGCCAWCNNILEGGDDYLEFPFHIDFQSSIYAYWDSPVGQNYYQLLYAVAEQSGGIDPRGVGCDVLIVMSGQYGGTGPNGGQIRGLTWGPGGPMDGRHSIMDVTSAWPANIFQHEVSHFFGADDHDQPGDQTFCIMSYTNVYNTRGYCTGCTPQISGMRDRYD